MKLKVSILSALLVMLLVPTACGRTNEPYAQELMMGAGDATLHVRIAGDPDAPNVLIAVHGGPGLSSSYMVSLEQLASQDFAVVTYDQQSSAHTTVAATRDYS